MADLATAYLHLKANMSGIKGDIEKELGGVSGKKQGEKLGSDLGGGIKGGIGKLAIGNFLGNALTKGAELGAEAIIQTVGDAFTQVMNYEQLAGGAQKIFDDVDYSQILGDAQNAYKELNMSANDYLESINQVGATFAQTMGDQKGYDTARQGMLAISDYASGTGRSIDELNEKYQMITRSTSSYQSIADQFSGILPATSADFLAQAQAAGLLSSEYTKLTEVPVAEYQSAVTSMLTQGVADLGLANNTMNESANTLSGSIATAKAAWTNFLTSLGSDDMDVSAQLDTLFASLGTAADLIAPMVTGKILPALGQALGQGVAYIITHIPEFLAAGGQLILGLVQGLAEGLTPAMGEMENVVNGALSAAGNFVGEMFNAGAQLIQGFIDGISSLIGSVGETITGGISGAVDGVLGFLGIASPSKLFASIGEYTMQGFANGIDGGAQGAADAMKSAVNDVMTGAGSLSGFTANQSVQANYSGSAIAESVSAQIDGLGIYLDGKTLVGGIAGRMDRALVM